MNFSKALKLITDEMAAALGAVDPGEMEALADAMAGAARVFVTGQGRSGLVARAFGMRLAHLGLSVQVVGDAASTAIGKGDLLVAVSCSGATDATCLVARKARSAGAARACVTAKRRSRLARMSGTVVIVPAPAKGEGRGARGSAQFGSTLFEQCCLVLLDALCLALMERLGQSHDRMMSRHSNLE